ncbi:MAG: DUF7282 domain-containing protein [Pikeienuella sp.]
MNPVFVPIVAFTATALIIATAITSVQAAGHAKLGVKAQDQSVAGGYVKADEIIAGENGWLVVHRTDGNGKPGPVVGHAPLAAGSNTDIAAILTEPVKSGEMLMLMLHAEAGGTKTGIFEYTLGAKEDGPVKVDGKLVMTIVTAE